RIPNESFGIRIPLARKSARDIEDFRAMAFPRIAKQSCGNRMIGKFRSKRRDEFRPQQIKYILSSQRYGATLTAATT
ncbi:hypothetical protein, partial [Rhodoblastus sp.]